MADERLEGKGELLADGDVLWVSIRDMVNPEGTFPDPLCFRRFARGPVPSEGEAWRERFRGVVIGAVAVVLLLF